MVHCFTFECSKVWSKDAFGHRDVCMPNEAVGNELQIGDFGKLAHSWEHDYVLNFLGKEHDHSTHAWCTLACIP